MNLGVTPDLTAGQSRMDWIDLEGTLASGAAAASWGTFETQIFAIGDDGQLANRYCDGHAWHAWETMGGPFGGQPAASTRAADRIDVLAVTPDGEVRHRWYDGTRWVPWRSLDGAPADPVDVACSWIGDRLDIFVRVAGGSLRYARSARTRANAPDHPVTASRTPP